ncbi:hypothetical protein [Gordonia sp. (in: high G+C Gram-positive bacteria)]|uniref:hypothetical protein n=1 Tax=Gordonia sp. (in: high G+C Gram-positive bacteria) TaxID=84139 RepID=UPI003F994B85
MTDPNTPDHSANSGQPPYGQPGQYPPPGYPGYQPPKKRKVWPWVLVGVIVLFIAMIGGCFAIVGGAAESIDNESKRVVTVTYEITGDGVGSAMYTTQNWDTAHDTDVTFPWKKDVQITGLGKPVSLMASNNFDSSGTIKCSIRQGDKVIAENTASGPGASANCSGSAE